MPLQNRVTPEGEIIAHPARGTFMGNRGIVHDKSRCLGKVRWRHKAWITCVLDFKGRHSDVMPPNGYTRLFFLDEAVAMAAGHRPCAECRRANFNRFMTHWASVHKTPKAYARDVDAILHDQRIDRRSRRQKTHSMNLNKLPDGVFIQLNSSTTPYLVMGDALRAYAFDTYGPPVTRPKAATVLVLTPPSSVDVLRDGYQPALHSSANVC